MQQGTGKAHSPLAKCTAKKLAHQGYAHCDGDWSMDDSGSPRGFVLRTLQAHRTHTETAHARIRMAGSKHAHWICAGLHSRYVGLLRYERMTGQSLRKPDEVGEAAQEREQTTQKPGRKRELSMRKP